MTSKGSCTRARHVPGDAPQGLLDARALELLLRSRRIVVVVLHLVLIAIANYIAFLLRFDGAIPPDHVNMFEQMLPWLVAIRGAAFFAFRLYQGLWRYTGIWDLRNIVLAVLLSEVAFFGLTAWGFGLTGYPRAVYVIDAIAIIGLVGGIRLVSRVSRQMGRLEQRHRILIYGAGHAGEMIVRDLRSDPHAEYQPVGFVDDDPAKIGQRIHGVRVLGDRNALPRIMRERRPDAVLVAMPRLAPRHMREILEALTPYKVPIQTLPRLGDVISNRVSVSRMRRLAVEDLLERAPVGIDAARVDHLIRGRCVLVTGAGGSIGSELCRQILRLEPSMLVMFERYENGLYAITEELAAGHGGDRLRAVVGDVTDVGRVDTVLGEHLPHIVFHAAAHKHVPLMEANPCEAVKNNVAGTRIMVEATLRHRVPRFVFISTDKAVNPSSVMGATKRVAELAVRALASRGPTMFSTVRFGNVLGSSGSVVPRFLEQIRNGGPVTVTHPEMRRYFMVIPEAVTLVLHAAALAQHEDVFVLEMGEQINILRMARNVIRLAGFVPEEEVPITFVGCRPGEKLEEELVGADEEIERTAIPEISRVRGRWQIPADVFMPQVALLEELAASADVKGVIRQLTVMVPTYRPAENGVVA